MTYTWRAGVLPEEAGEEPPVELSDDRRRRLEAVADRMIPATAEMPAASEVGVARGQLELVIRSRPDLTRPLTRALERAEPGSDADIAAWLERLRDDDPAAHEALVTVVLAGYYLSDEVRQRLGYPGQEPAAVNIGYPAYVEEGLLDAVTARGPRYRGAESDAG